MMPSVYQIDAEYKQVSSLSNGTTYMLYQNIFFKSKLTFGQQK